MRRICCPSMWGHFISFQDVKLLADDISELKPTVLAGVPRIYDRIYNGEGGRMGGLKAP